MDSQSGGASFPVAMQASMFKPQEIFKGIVADMPGSP